MPGQFLHHPDAGSRHSVRFTEHLAIEGIPASVGDAYDALMEST